MFLDFLKERTTAQQRNLLNNKMLSWKAFFYRSHLNKLAQIHGSDKWGAHWYTQHYAFHFQSMRRKKMNIFEIGVGGYETPYLGGNSLRMWRDYFSNSTIVSLDIHDKSPLNEKRIKIYQGSQADIVLLTKIHEQSGPFDIIIDDGSHINEHVITSFQHLFPLLEDGGIYVVEDTQTSYFKDFGADTHDLDSKQNMMGFFKQLVHGLNYMEYNDLSGYQPSYYEEHIQSIHFYHNMVMIHKKKNWETSNLQKS